MNKLTPEEAVKKYKLDQLHWVKKGFHGVLHYHYVFWNIGFDDFKNFFGEEYSFVLDFFSGSEKAEWYLCHEDMVRMREAVISKIKKDREYLNFMFEEWKKRTAVFDTLISNIENIQLSDLTDTKLYELYTDFNRQYIHTINVAIVVQDPFSMTADEHLVPHFKKILKLEDSSDKFADFFTVLMAPVDPSFLSLEEYELAVLVTKKNNGEISDSDLDVELTAHASKYHWIQNNYAHVVRLNSNYFKNRLLEINQNQANKIIYNYQTTCATNIKQKRDLIEQLRLDDWSKILIKIVETFTHMQDTRKMYTQKTVAVMKLFMEEYGKRLGMSYDDMKWTYIDELPELFNKTGKEKEELVARRKVGSVFIGSAKTGVHVFDGEDVQKLHDLIFKASNEIVNEIKGVVASKGKVSGKARIIHTVGDLHKMRQDEILVASMTRPEMVSAMKLAVAIVTDEGGITSHAAVVSRELNVPCVIGTKIATQIFKDGDILEVDANSGVVKKI